MHRERSILPLESDKRRKSKPVRSLTARALSLLRRDFYFLQTFKREKLKDCFFFFERVIIIIYFLVVLKHFWILILQN